MQKFEKLTDDCLVSAYANGNNEAFDELLARHQNRLRLYILALVKDKNLAEDIFQETFVKAIMTIKQGTYSANGKFSAWISRIARNLVIDHFRQNHNEMPLQVEGEHYDVLNRRDLCEDNIEDLMIDSQIRTDLRRLIRHLPDTQREVLLMRYYRNLSFKEIAEKTGVSINTALGRMRYAIMSLRRMARESNVALTR